jgi:glycosyl hydrolase family 20
MNYLVIKNFNMIDGNFVPEFLEKEIILNLSPKPVDIYINPNLLALSEEMVLNWGGNPLIEKFVDEFLDELKNRNLPIPKVSTTEIDVVINPNLETIVNSEAYYLEINDDEIVIQGNTEKGIFYGLQTIYQLFYDYHGTLVLPYCKIIDYPVMGIRGISDENSRGQAGTIANVKKFIKVLSRFKLNVYQFYWEDMYRFESYPMIGKERGGWTKEDVKEVEQYALEHCVDLYPILNSLGHMETYFWNPELKHLGEFPGSQCINVAHPEAYKFLETLFNEIGTTFSSTSFHIGADESRHVGFYGSKELVEKEGIGNVYLKHYNFCIETLKKLGKKRIFLYSDISSKYKEVLEGVDSSSAIFVVWDYGIQQKYGRMMNVVEHKLPFIVSSSALNWYRIFPFIDTAVKSNHRIIEEGLKYGALGQINSSWGDNGNESFRENRLHSFGASSSMSWNFDAFSVENYNRAFFIELFGVFSKDIDNMWTNMTLIQSKMPSKIDVDPWNKFYAQLWRHPFARWEHGVEELDHAGIGYSVDYKEDQRPFLNETLDLIEKIRPTIKKNEINLDYFKFAVESIIIFIDKIQATMKIDILEKQVPLDIKAITKIIVPIRDKFKQLKEEYARLWNACARAPRLDKILQYFDWMIFWYEEKLEQINNGVAFKCPMLAGEWISYDEGGDKTDEPRYFRKSFSLSKEEMNNLKKITVQMIPGSYGILWINGTEIGRAPENKNSTELPLDLRELFATIQPNVFKEGENLMEIQVQVWPDGWPVHNTILHFAFENEIEERYIFTDRTWRASKSKEGPWERPRSHGRTPFFSKEAYMPNFEKGWHSAYTLDNFLGLVMTIATNKSPITKWFIMNWEFSNLFM